MAAKYTISTCSGDAGLTDSFRAAVYSINSIKNVECVSVFPQQPAIYLVYGHLKVRYHALRSCNLTVWKFFPDVDSYAVYQLPLNS